MVKDHKKKYVIYSQTQDITEQVDGLFFDYVNKILTILAIFTFKRV